MVTSNFRNQESGIRNQRMGKRGLISNFLAFFGATIAVVLILTFFVLGAGIVKKLDNKGSSVAIYSEENVEIDNIFDYSNRYVRFSEARFNITGGSDINSALEEMREMIAADVVAADVVAVKNAEFVRGVDR